MNRIRPIFEYVSAVHKVPSHLEKGAIMIRSAAAILALAILPGFAASQQPAQTTARMHVVVKGETLWALAQRYYDDPFAWPRIYDANRAVIADPNLIQPDQEFRIPGLVQSDEPAVVGAVRVVSPPSAEPEPEVEPAQVGRARSRFFRDLTTEFGVRRLEDRPYLILSRASMWSAEWLGPEVVEDIESDGVIESFVGDEDVRTARPYTRVRIEFAEGFSPRVGDALQVYRPVRTVEGLGSILRPMGVLSVTRNDRVTSEGIVLQPFARIRLGDFVRAAPVFDLEPGQYPEVVSSRAEATILEFGEVQGINGLGLVAILDKGSENGVGTGDEYVLFAGDGSTEEVLGRLQVVATNPSTSSARIVGVEGSVFTTGLSVHLDRKMR